MFKKKPQIKNLSPLRSSDRRKLADQIIAQYHVEGPSQPQESGSTDPTLPTLSSVRASLVPESCLSARFTTHAGANATLVSGTVYVGAYTGHEERILWIQYGKEQKLYPTVYTLWQNPGLVPLLHTQDFVIEKMKTGADLMIPGLAGGPPWPGRAKQGTVVAVAGMTNATVPACVGTCKLDISTLGDVRGQKGAAVEGIHWEGDELWNWSQTGIGGRPSPEGIQGWEAHLPGAGSTAAKDMASLALDDEDDEADEEGGVALNMSRDDFPQNGHTKELTQTDEDGKEGEQREPTTKEVDQAFRDAFVYAVYNAKKNGSAPHYDLPFPIQPSFLVANMIQPHLRYQDQHYTIKKTSWKNTKKFIKQLDKELLVKSKDRNGGETVILDIDFQDQHVKNFTPYRLPKPKTAAQNASDMPTDTSSTADQSLGQKLNLVTVYRASSKLVPDLIPSKTAYYTAPEISSYLKKYVENNPELTQKSSSPRFIKLDPFIANNILGSNSSANDTKTFAAGEIGRDVLQRRVLEDDHLCVPYWLLLRNDQTWDPENPSLKPKAGAAPKALITIEKRTGTKVVTKLAHLEVFGINPNILGPELQKKCAGSASVGQLVGGKPGTLEILIQGDQKDVIEKELGRRGVDRRWIEVLDKTKKKSGTGGASGGGGSGRR